MEENIGWVVIVIAVLLLLIIGFHFLPGGIYYAFAVLGFVTNYSLDQLFSVGLFPALPWMMWTVWGSVIGAAFAYWTIAPIYGMQRRRRQILFSPFVLMVLVMLVRLLLQR